jgi:hypothetical protein
LNPIQTDEPCALASNRAGFLGALRLTAGRIFAATLLATRFANVGNCRPSTTREWLYTGLAQKGQTQQQKSDCDEALHGKSKLLFPLRHSFSMCKLSRNAGRIWLLVAQPLCYKAFFKLDTSASKNSIA